MTHESLNPNQEGDKRIHSFEDIRTVIRELPKNREELNALTEEIKELIKDNEVKVELEPVVQTVMYEIEVANKDTAKLTDEQRYFLEQISGKLEEFIARLEQQ
ncbi:MAG: hypothetical protein V4686_00905 [Patescibacteria group bacterium]